MDFNSQYRQCPNGHWYDASITDTCPQCAARKGERTGGMEQYGVTEPIPRGGAYGVGRTEPAAGAVERYSPTEPVDSAWSTPPEKAESAGQSGVMESYGATMPAETPIASGKAVGFSPVVGWLVCVEGPDRGRDYRIHTGYNRIGRAENMDICITGDPHISRSRHAMIAYDPEERLFFFGPDEGKSIVRLNGKLVMSPSELHAYDVITLGASASPTRLMFVPFCGERFGWDG